MFVVAETSMFAVMAYGWLVAVCNPLLHTVVMLPELCASLVAGGRVSSLTFTYFHLTLPFFGSDIINNFVCEHSFIVCSDPYISQVLCLVIAIFNEVSSLVIILTTCIFIFVIVIKMPSAGGTKKPPLLVPPTWQPFPFSTGLFCSFIVCPAPKSHDS